MTTRIVLTGSESTGKTTLARELAAHYGATWCGEYVRDYLAVKGSLDSADVEPIALGQLALQNAANGPLVIHDTDLLSTVVYARHYYGDVAEWIVRAARARRPALYLLMDIDVPWVADPQRDRGHMRETMHALFRDALEELGAPYVVVSGDWETRRRRAIAAVDALRAAS